MPTHAISGSEARRARVDMRAGRRTGRGVGGPFSRILDKRAQRPHLHSSFLNLPPIILLSALNLPQLFCYLLRVYNSVFMRLSSLETVKSGNYVCSSEVRSTTQPGTSGTCKLCSESARLLSLCIVLEQIADSRLVSDAPSCASEI